MGSRESKLRKAVDYAVVVFIEGFVIMFAVLIAAIGIMMIILSVVINVNNPLLVLVKWMFLPVGLVATLLGVFEYLRFSHQHKTMTPDSMLQLAIVLFLLFIVLLSLYFLLPLLPAILHVHAPTGTHPLG
ncbi:MAG: hypothetical protein RXQ94_02385 [Caldivirga sp.]